MHFFVCLFVFKSQIGQHFKILLLLLLLTFMGNITCHFSDGRTDGWIGWMESNAESEH